MTTTETTNRTSESKITRRKMLQTMTIGSTATAAALIVPGQSHASHAGKQVSSELLELIHQHRRAWEALEGCCNAADSVHPEYGGAEAEAIWNMRSDAERDALQAVLEFPVSNLADARAKAVHLISEDFGLDRYDTEMLLESIADEEAGIDSADSPTHHSARFDDLELLRLGEKFEAAFAVEEAARLIGRETDDWTAWDEAYEITGKLVHEIEQHEATTLDGLKVKARCIQWCYGDDPVCLGMHTTTDNRLANQIVKHLLALA